MSPKDGARCDLCPRNGQPFVAPCGDAARATFLWLDEEPRARQVKGDDALAGSSMQRLEQLHGAALAERQRSFDLNEVYITFGALCAAVDRTKDVERRQALTCCRPRVLAELARAPATGGMLACGKWAVYALTGSEQKVEKKNGFHVEWELGAAHEMAAAAIAKREAKAVKTTKKKA